MVVLQGRAVVAVGHWTEQTKITGQAIVHIIITIQMESK
jgi:hypothetical protein